MLTLYFDHCAANLALLVDSLIAGVSIPVSASASGVHWGLVALGRPKASSHHDERRQTANKGGQVLAERVYRDFIQSYAEASAADLTVHELCKNASFSSDSG